MASADTRVREFEQQLDRALFDRPTTVFGGTDSIRLAANVVEFAEAERPEMGHRLSEGLQVLAPMLITRQPGVTPEIAVLGADLDFAAHYHLLRDFLYFTYNAPGSIEWSFGDHSVDVRFRDASIPRQFFLIANSWFLDSMRIFADETRSDRVKELIKGSPEFESSQVIAPALELILDEVRLKLSAYFNFVSNRDVSVGAYRFSAFLTVYEALLAKALYHRYHAQVNGRRGAVFMPFEKLVRDTQADLAEQGRALDAMTIQAVISDISYGVEAHRSKLNPVYFSLYHLADQSQIVMLPYHFATWEGFVNFLRLVALRDPATFLAGVSSDIGAGLVRRLSKAFQAAGFACSANVPLAKFGADLPDIDLLVVGRTSAHEYLVLICEVKSPLPPRWGKDQVRVLQPDSVSKAFTQLDRIRGFFESERGPAFLFEQVQKMTGAATIDAITPAPLVATSDNAGAFFSDRGTIIDFRTLERLLSRCGGDIAYLFACLRDIPQWADNCMRRLTASVRVGDLDVTYEGVTIGALMDFREAGARAGESRPLRFDS